MLFKREENVSYKSGKRKKWKYLEIEKVRNKAEIFLISI